MNCTSTGSHQLALFAAFVPALGAFYILPAGGGGYDLGRMPLLHNELARWKNGQLELRPQPLRVKWVFEDLVTSDGHGLRCTFTCSVQGLADPTERRMLQEVLLAGRPAGPSSKRCCSPRQNRAWHGRARPCGRWRGRRSCGSTRNSRLS